MNTVQTWLSVIANIAIVATFIVYWRQLAAMRGQLAASQEASRSQNLLALIEFLQRPAFVEARGVLMSLESTPPDNWTPEQRFGADRAIAGYDIVAILLREDAIPRARAVIIENWGHSIRSCYAAAAPYIQKAREKRGANYWDDFEWLAGEAKKPNQSPEPTSMSVTLPAAQVSRRP